MIKAILCVGAGSCLGGMLRYLVYLLTDHLRIHSSWATMIVNIVGCMILGVICGVIDKGGNISNNLRLFLVFGICGGFTTFSTFINDGFKLMRGGEMFYAIGYAALSIFIGLALLYCGYLLGRKI
ncbi:MAG: CrcB family protein [Bacteroidales bacterium]|nr:CrcB family protein [Candidatus Colimorpha pelethequi]